MAVASNRRQRAVLILVLSFVLPLFFVASVWAEQSSIALLFLFGIFPAVGIFFGVRDFTRTKKIDWARDLEGSRFDRLGVRGLPPDRKALSQHLEECQTQGLFEPERFLLGFNVVSGVPLWLDRREDRGGTVICGADSPTRRAILEATLLQQLLLPFHRAAVIVDTASDPEIRHRYQDLMAAAGRAEDLIILGPGSILSNVKEGSYNICPPIFPASLKLTRLLDFVDLVGGVENQNFEDVGTLDLLTKVIHVLDLTDRRWTIADLAAVLRDFEQGYEWLRELARALESDEALLELGRVVSQCRDAKGKLDFSEMPPQVRELGVALDRCKESPLAALLKCGEGTSLSAALHHNKVVLFTGIEQLQAAERELLLALISEELQQVAAQSSNVETAALFLVELEEILLQSSMYEMTHADERGGGSQSRLIVGSTAKLSSAEAVAETASLASPSLKQTTAVSEESALTNVESPAQNAAVERRMQPSTIVFLNEVAVAVKPSEADRCIGRVVYSDLIGNSTIDVDARLLWVDIPAIPTEIPVTTAAKGIPFIDRRDALGFADWSDQIMLEREKSRGETITHARKRRTTSRRKVTQEAYETTSAEADTAAQIRLPVAAETGEKEVILSATVAEPRAVSENVTEDIKRKVNVEGATHTVAVQSEVTSSSATESALLSSALKSDLTKPEPAVPELTIPNTVIPSAVTQAAIAGTPTVVVVTALPAPEAQEKNQKAVNTFQKVRKNAKRKTATRTEKPVQDIDAIKVRIKEETDERNIPIPQSVESEQAVTAIHAKSSPQNPRVNPDLLISDTLLGGDVEEVDDASLLAELEELLGTQSSRAESNNRKSKKAEAIPRPPSRIAQGE